MATALYSGCDFFSYWSTAPQDVAGTVYAGTGSNGSSGPPAGTKMTFVGQYLDVITSGQLAALNAYGISVFFFYENSGSGSIQPSFNVNYLAATTYAQGVIDANACLSALSTLGIGPWPVYFAVDYDATTLPQQIALGNYFEGVYDTMGAANACIYGSGFIVTAINLQLNGSGRLALPMWCQSRSSGWSGNGNYSNSTGSTQTLWQWPPGYSPSGGVTINGHGVDGEFAYATNFGQYPYTAGTGVLTYATVTNPSITYTQPEPQTIIVPKYKYDRALFSKVYPTSVTASSWPQTITYGSTGINQYAYPFGNYTASVNGGPSQTNDFGFIYANDYGSFVGLLPTVVVQPIVDSSGNLTFNVTVNGVSGSVTVDLTINIALLATPTPSALPSTSVSQTTAYSNIIPGAQPTPYATYRRISKDSSVGSGGHTVAHGQGVVPNVLIWGQDTSGTIEMQPIWWSSAGASTSFGISLDNTNIYFYVDAANSYAWYRTYLDN